MTSLSKPYSSTPSNKQVGENMVDFENATPEEQFSIRVTLAMGKAIQDGADVDSLAWISANTAFELYEHYDAGDDYDSFTEFVVGTAFQADEVDEWLDRQEEEE